MATVKVECPLCAGVVGSGGYCSCGYLHVDAAGRPHTLMHGSTDYYRPEPNIPVFAVGDVEGADDKVRKSRTTERGSLGGASS